MALKVPIFSQEVQREPLATVPVSAPKGTGQGISSITRGFADIGKGIGAVGRETSREEERIRLERKREAERKRLEYEREQEKIREANVNDAIADLTKEQVDLKSDPDRGIINFKGRAAGEAHAGIKEQHDKLRDELENGLSSRDEKAAFRARSSRSINSFYGDINRYVGVQGDNYALNAVKRRADQSILSAASSAEGGTFIDAMYELDEGGDAVASFAVRSGGTDDDALLAKNNHITTGVISSIDRMLELKNYDGAGEFLELARNVSSLNEGMISDKNITERIHAVEVDVGSEVLTDEIWDKSNGDLGAALQWLDASEAPQDIRENASEKLIDKEKSQQNMEKIRDYDSMYQLLDEIELSPSGRYKSSSRELYLEMGWYGQWVVDEEIRDKKRSRASGESESQRRAKKNDLIKGALRQFKAIEDYDEQLSLDPFERWEDSHGTDAALEIQGLQNKMKQARDKGTRVTRGRATDLINARNVVSRMTKKRRDFVRKYAHLKRVNYIAAHSENPKEELFDEWLDEGEVVDIEEGLLFDKEVPSAKAKLIENRTKARGERKRNKKESVNGKPVYPKGAKKEETAPRGPRKAGSVKVADIRKRGVSASVGDYIIEIPNKDPNQPPRTKLIPRAALERWLKSDPGIRVRSEVVE